MVNIIMCHLCSCTENREGRKMADDETKKQTAKELRQTDRDILSSRENISVGKVQDINNRIVFRDHTLCAQFLRGYTGIDVLRNILPEDIEDVTEKYQAYLGISFETDTVKCIHIKEFDRNMPMYLISLIEHKSEVDYNVSMQMLRYMICIWDDYARKMKKNRLGDSKNKGFLYPPILPIVYYEGAGKWLAPMSLGERIFMKDVFAAYIPDFTYRLVDVHNYTNEELLLHEDKMSLLMMINRIQNPSDFSDFINANHKKIRRIIDNASESILHIITSTLWSLFMKMQVPVDEAQRCVSMIGGRQMGNWFENMEKMDLQAERRNTKEAREALAEARRELDDTKSALSDTRSELSDKESRLSATEFHLAKTITQLTKNLSGTKESAVARLMNDCGKTQDEAAALIDECW